MEGVFSQGHKARTGAPQKRRVCIVHARDDMTQQSAGEILSNGPKQIPRLDQSTSVKGQADGERGHFKEK